ncbi:hypothetical protein NQ314_020599, partial [Rhamnusium bicolor]
KQYASMPQLFHQDNYDKCMLLKDEALYCTFTYELQPLKVNNVSETWKIINKVSSDRFNYRHDNLRHGICVPFACPSNEKSNDTDTILSQRITNCYNKKFEKVGLKGTVTFLQCETNDPKYPIDWLDITVAIVCISYIVLIVFASFYEGVAKYKQETDYQKITTTRWGLVIAAFSIQRNWHRFKTIKSNPDIEKLRPFQGVRFYNMLIVIMSHTVLASMMLPVANTKYTETCISPTWYLALDTQYFVSLLFIIWFMKKYPRLIWPTLGCLLSINIVLTFIQNYKGNYALMLLPLPEVIYDMKNVLKNPQFHYQMTNVIGCASGPIMGLGYGYIFYKFKNQKLFTSNLMFHQILYYIISYGVGLGIVLLPGMFFIMNGAQHDPFWASLYIASSRPLFSFAIGYCLFGATQGLGFSSVLALRKYTDLRNINR